MKHLLSAFMILILGELFASCDFQNKNAHERGNEQTYAEKYIKDIDNAKDTPDSVKAIVRTLVTDSMRWWGLDILTNNPDSLSRIYHRHLDTINMAMQWSNVHKSNDFIKGRLWNQKGLYLSKIHQIDSATYCFNQAYGLFRRSKCYDEQSTATMNLAGIYYRKGKLTTSAEYYKRACLLADSLNNTHNCVSSHIALAQIYTDLKNFSRAQHHLDKAEEIIDQANINELFFYYFARGTCYYYQEKNALAYAAFTLALEYANKLDKFQQTMCQATLAETSLTDGNTDLAMSHVAHCIEVLNAYPNTLIKTVKFYLCSITMDVLLTEGKIEEARKLMTQLPKDEEVLMPRYLSFHYKQLSDHASTMGFYEKAYKYLEIANKYQDQINNENVVSNIIEISQRYQRDTTYLRQNVTIANLENKMSRRQLRLTIIIAGLLLVLSACIIAIVMIRRHNDRRHHAQLQQIYKLRMDIVRNRISPHYIFNVLAMMLPKFKSNPELHQLSELFIEVIRGNLLASNQMAIKFSDELKLVKQYVSLYHMSKSAYPVVKWHDATNGNADNILVPTMCLQIPVENALKHAFSELDESCTIDIYIMTENERLILNIIDNGEGYNPGKVVATGRDTGTGLRVLSRTIYLFNKYNSHTIEFHINNLSKDKIRGTEVKISIPFNYHYTE